jgi:hypothetical protein
MMKIEKDERKCTELGPPKGIEPGLRPVAIDGGD